jgi:selenocysteine-specific elongation factor
MWERVSVLYGDEQPRPPTIHEVAAQLPVDRAALEKFLERMAQRGHLVRVSDTRYFTPNQLQKLGELAQALAGEASDGTFAAALYRDRSNLGRNLTIELLEYFDRVGLTQLTDGRRRVRRDPAFLDA